MIFVDTSAFIALATTSDMFHTEAVVWRASKKEEVFLTSHLVVLETLGWLRYKLGKREAVRFGWPLIAGEGIKVERVTQSDEHSAWELFQKADGRGVSMVDCTSVVLMKRQKIREIFSFDQDFAHLGFTVVP